MSRVVLARCEDYDPEATRRAVREALEQIPEAGEIFGAGRKVVLKPNLLSSTHPPEAAVNTHPSVLGALTEYAVEQGARVILGDSCGCLSLDSTEKAIEITGLRAIAERTGAEVVNFDRTPAEEVRLDGSSGLGSVRIPKVVLEADALVTVPKFKTHGLTLLTGAVKNLLGLVPGKGKKDVHVAAPKPESMARALVDLFAACPPALAVMDAVVGMEGEGPAGGRARPVGYVMASADAVALDAVQGAMMGFAPGQVLTTAQAAARGLGVADLESIEIVGASLEEARIDDWALPASARMGFLWRLAPSAFVSWAFRQVGGAHAEVDPERCVQCGLCVRNCPADALTLDGREVRCAPEECIACYCCAEVCPENAIRMKRPLVGAALNWLHRRVGKRSGGGTT